MLRSPGRLVTFVREVSSATVAIPGARATTWAFGGRNALIWKLLQRRRWVMSAPPAMTHSTAMATGSMTLAPVEARLPPLPPPPTDAACAVVDWVVADCALVRWVVADWVVDLVVVGLVVVDWVDVLGVVEDVVGWVGWVGWVGLVVPDGEGEGTGELGAGEPGAGEPGAGEPGAGSGSVVASPTR